MCRLWGLDRFFGFFQERGSDGRSLGKAEGVAGPRHGVRVVTCSPARDSSRSASTRFGSLVYVDEEALSAKPCDSPLGGRPGSSPTPFRRGVWDRYRW